MALSVSGFPEPSRQPGSSNEVFTGESGQDNPSKAGLMNSPRLRGLFGGGNTPSKRSEPIQPPVATKSDVDVEGLQTTTPAITPPTTPSISFATSAFPPMPQEEYELGLQLPMSEPLETSQVHTGKRAQLPPLPRKTTVSPVRLGPSLTRLDIGAGLRTAPTVHPHSKPPPPSVVVEEWGAVSSAAAHPPRPLPSVPGPTQDPMKSSPSSPSSTAGPSRHTKVASPTAGPSRNVNAIAGPSKHVNAIAGPSKYQNDRSGPSSSSPLSSISAGMPPSSKILITELSPPRTHKQNAPSLSMRFQPLVVDSSGSPSADPSSPASASQNATVSSPVRPLPRVPPATTAPAAIRVHAPKPSRYITPPAKIKRPKTSPSSISGFTPPTLSTTNITPRNAFSTIPNSWASRPVDLNAQRPTSPSATVRPLIVRYPRARSHSRLRRDRSVDSIYSRTTPPIRAPSPATVSTPIHGSRAIRTLPSPTLIGARPLPKKSPTFDSMPKKLPTIRTSDMKPAMTTRSAHTVLSPGARRPPPSPPTGPVPRVKSPSTYSPSSRPHTPSADAPKLAQQVPASLPPLPPIVTSTQSIMKDAAVLAEPPMHLHPADAFADSESLLHPKASPIEPTSESPIEVFLDNQDYSTVSRSPSPIRYARPDSRGNLTDTTDDDVPSDSESSSSRASSRTRGRRTQLRAYRKSYRPQPGNLLPHVPFRSPSPPQRSLEEEKDKGKKGKKEKKPGRSYFGGGESRSSATGSTPPTRASSPERKSRSRQPRRLAEAMSMALGGRLTAPAGAAAGSSVAFPIETDVLDISLPADASSMSGSSSNVASVDETPFMWVSTNKPLIPPAPFVPEPPPHRRVNSLGFGGDDREQSHGVACGLRPRTTTITSTVSVSGSRPPSTLSSPFSAFSRSSKKKRTNSVPLSNEFSYEQMVGEEQTKHGDSEAAAVVVTTRRIVRGVDYVGDVWEQEHETAVAEVIPHLRTLKARKG